ncbi:TetR/AcrR family transcriptional regulator [Mycobacterium sp.]|uniref:TetR/AcrR family transcriptional regulator n=1 Tax=Mycobacterium sp. TaxID=1785 RepID=UPI003D0AC2FA
MSIAEPSGFGSERPDLADRILEAARQLVLRSGVRKLSLADVATLAGVSRPTIYRYFVSKEDLIEALGEHERRRFDAAMEQATSGVTGAARLEAAVDVVASFLEDQPPGRQLDLDPGFAQDQMARALPMISGRLSVVLAQCVREGALDAAANARDLAGAIARVAMSHYMFREKDPAAARREIRATAGLPNGRSRMAGPQSKRRRRR